MGSVTSGKRAAQGKHAGPARLAEPAAKRGSSTGPMLLLALGITASLVAWGYLVYLAIDFGTSARDGDSRGWTFLGLATVGAIACLFLALMLGTRLVSRLRASAPPPQPPRPPGGRRALR
jgi:disulfide bond formation protein DsbB